MDVIILTGAPSVGKTRVLPEVSKVLEQKNAWLDGDDVGRTNPVVWDMARLNLIQDNMCACAKEFAQWGAKYFIAGFVISRQNFIDQIVGIMQQAGHRVFVIGLIANAEVLTKRYTARPRYHLECGPEFLDNTIRCSNLIGELPGVMSIDTSYLDPVEVALAIKDHVEDKNNAQKPTRPYQYSPIVAKRYPTPNPVPTLKGDIVTLRPIDPPRDAQDYYQWNLEPAMHRWTDNHVLGSVEIAQAELEKFNQREDMITWAVVDNSSNKMMGRFYIYLEKRDGKLFAGEGNRIAQPYWRKGHNRQARQLISKYTLDVLEADFYETACWSDNINAKESIKAHGFVLVDEITQYNEKYNRHMNKCVFRMTPSQWEQLQSAKPE